MVRTGLDHLIDDPTPIRGKRIGLICNPSSVDGQLRHSAHLMAAHPQFDLRALFGPQHGIRGETQDNMIEWEGFHDELLDLPAFSLYGTHRKPTPEMLAGLDALVFDVQDVGARYYTFIYTMALAMEACAEADIECIVLDRPNPINGVDVEGPVLHEGLESFVGMYPIPLRHGMTVGELARLFNEHFGIGCRLRVIPMTGWTRSQYFEETRLPWVLPSPNMPTVDTAVVYPGMCLFEGTNVSEGRGTTRPFELSGAPWAHPDVLCGRLKRRRDLQGAIFRAVYVQPTFHKWAERVIGGVQIHVTNRSQFRPVRTALVLLKEYRDLSDGAFEWKQPPYEYEYVRLPFDILSGDRNVRIGIEEGEEISDIEAAWLPRLAEFESIRKPFLLYRD